MGDTAPPSPSPSPSPSADHDKASPKANAEPLAASRHHHHNNHHHPDHASTVVPSRSTLLDAGAEAIDRNLLAFRYAAYATAAGCALAALLAARRMPLFAVARTPAQLAALSSPVASSSRLRRAWVRLLDEPVAVSAPASGAGAEAAAATETATETSAAPAEGRDAGAEGDTAAVPLLAVRHVPLLAAWVLPRARQEAWAGPVLRLAPYALAPSGADEARVVEEAVRATHAAAGGRLLAATVCELQEGAPGGPVAVCRLRGRRPGRLRREDVSQAALAAGRCGLDHAAVLRAEAWPGGLAAWQADLERLRRTEADARLAGRGRWRDDAAYARPASRFGSLTALVGRLGRALGLGRRS